MGTLGTRTVHGIDELLHNFRAVAGTITLGANFSGRSRDSILSHGSRRSWSTTGTAWSSHVGTCHGACVWLARALGGSLGKVFRESRGGHADGLVSAVGTGDLLADRDTGTGSAGGPTVSHVPLQFAPVVDTNFFLVSGANHGAWFGGLGVSVSSVATLLRDAGAQFGVALGQPPRQFARGHTDGLVPGRADHMAGFSRARPVGHIQGEVPCDTVFLHTEGLDALEADDPAGGALVYTIAVAPGVPVCLFVTDHLLSGVQTQGFYGSSGDALGIPHDVTHRELSVGTIAVGAVNQRRSRRSRGSF